LDALVEHHQPVEIKVKDVIGIDVHCEGVHVNGPRGRRRGRRDE
jgi:hypothetical protein